MVFYRSESFAEHKAWCAAIVVRVSPNCIKIELIRAISSVDLSSAIQHAIADISAANSHDFIISPQNQCMLQRNDQEQYICLEFLYKKWRQQDSNLRPSTRQADALPAELCLHEMIINDIVEFGKKMMKSYLPYLSIQTCIHVTEPENCGAVEK